MELYKLQTLKITNFRNLSDKPIYFNEGINCIFGKNGNGKTNILEAIYYLCTKKSFRKNTSFPQMISVDSGKPEIIIQSTFLSTDLKLKTLSGKTTSSGSVWFANNKQVKSKPRLGSVFINPFDSYSFHNIPSFRRNWFDQNLSQMSKTYKSILTRYNQAIKQRNSLLSTKNNNYLLQVETLDEQISEYTFKILSERMRFITDLQSQFSKIFKEIFSEKHNLEVEISSKFLGLDVEAIKTYYSENIKRDILAGITTYGIHKDDYLFSLDGFNSYEFSSLGQQKMSYLSLIFAYIELFRYKFNSYPIILIDDVSGELDTNRWENLINYLEKREFQVMITTANKNFESELIKIKDSKTFYVDNGQVS